MIQETSVKAYRSIKDNLTPLHLKILMHIRDNPNCTDREICQGTDIDINSVTARRNELIEQNKIRVSGNKTNLKTGLENMTYKAITKETEDQLEKQMRKANQIYYKEMKQLSSQGMFKCRSCHRYLNLEYRCYHNKGYCTSCMGE